jgi:hypothetical protein
MEVLRNTAQHQNKVSRNKKEWITITENQFQIIDDSVIVREAQAFLSEG